MNKAFFKKPDQGVEFCPHCGVKGGPVGEVTLWSFLRQKGELVSSRC